MVRIMVRARVRIRVRDRSTDSTNIDSSKLSTLPSKTHFSVYCCNLFRTTENILASKLIE